MKIDLYKMVYGIVCDACEVKCDVLVCRCQSCVEARAMLVRALLDVGFRETDVAVYTGLTRQCVNKLKNTFDARMRDWGFRRTWKEVSNNIATMCQ